MKIWVDADACPQEIKEILYKTADRLDIPTVLVANMKLRTPDIPSVSTIQVPGGADVADEYIIEHLSKGDFVITAGCSLRGEGRRKRRAGHRPARRGLYRGKRGRAAVVEKLHDGYALGRICSGRPTAHGRS